MAFRQGDIPKLSGAYFSTAEAMARRHDLRWVLRLADIGAEDDGRIRWVSANGHQTLPGLVLLSRLRDLAPYQAPNREHTRQNVTTVARVGASALRHLHDVAQGRGVTLSGEAMHGIHDTLATIQGGMEEAFRPIVREIGPDREALFFLNAAGRILKGKRL